MTKLRKLGKSPVFWVIFLAIILGWVYFSVGARFKVGQR